MRAKFTKHALVRRVDGASAGARHSAINHACNDNQRVDTRTTVRRRKTRRPVLSCHWRVVPATGALECFWQAESADGAAAPSPWRSRMRHVREARWRARRDHVWNSQRAPNCRCKEKDVESSLSHGGSGGRTAARRLGDLRRGRAARLLMGYARNALA
jgi:hypothetical protein